MTNQQEILYYRKLEAERYQLLLRADGTLLVLGTFHSFGELEALTGKYFPAASLEKIPRDPQKANHTNHHEVDNIYLPLQGEALRRLSWGMSRQKVARLEQIEGGEHILVKTEPMHGFYAGVQFGFDHWAHCGLEYIAYSSPDPGFREAMERDLEKTHGQPERVVDYHGLDRLMVKGRIKDEGVLARFIKEPEDHYFNRFICDFNDLTFRSALKWNRGDTVCLSYRKRQDACGDRNKHNYPYVLEFWPTVLFDFYQEQFAEIYLSAH